MRKRCWPDLDSDIIELASAPPGRNHLHSLPVRQQAMSPSSRQIGSMQVLMRDGPPCEFRLGIMYRFLDLRPAALFVADLNGLKLKPCTNLLINLSKKTPVRKRRTGFQRPFWLPEVPRFLYASSLSLGFRLKMRGRCLRFISSFSFSFRPELARSRHKQRFTAINSWRIWPQLYYLDISVCLLTFAVITVFL
jgi:hypothetical protein